MARSLSTQQALDHAVAHHGAGRLPQAERGYQQILQTSPNQPIALHLLGVIAHQTGKNQVAVDLITQALAIAPDYDEAHSNLGLVLQGLGKLDDAVASYREALAINPDIAETHNNLGLALHGLGKLNDAVASYAKALAIKPDFAEAHYNLGLAVQSLGKLDEAVASYHKTLAIAPDYAEAHNNLGLALQGLGRLDDAVASYAKALAIKSEFSEAHNNLGVALQGLGKLDDAVARYRKALAIAPDYAEAHSNLGITLKEQGKLGDAVASYHKALAIAPDYAKAHNNLGIALRGQGKLDDAVASFRKALKLKPDHADAQYNLGMSLMLLGKLDEGFRNYEWRWKTGEFRPREFPQPLWGGQEFADKTVLIHAEQGLGDTIQFIRYAPLCRVRGGRVVFECPKPLVELLRGIDGVDHLVPKGDPVSPFDFHVPLLNLPGIFGTTLADIPADVPYISRPDGISPPPLDPDEGRLRVGIVWQGNPRQKNNHNRSCPLHHFEALARRDDIVVYSLQVGSVAADLEDLAVDAPIHDMGTQFNNFADTAAVIAQLDLVISVDTAVAHLAGAMARPVWALLCFAPDWRWLLERDDCPWYPTMRLFRQPRPGDWHHVFDRVDRALTVLTAEGDRP